MSIPSNGPPKSFTSQEIDAWVLAAQEQRAKLHLQAARPCNSDEHHDTFAGMSELLLEAFEEMRLVSESLREGSQAVRRESVDLRAHSHRLIGRGKTLTEQMAQFASPSPEDIQKAESQILEIFKRGNQK